MPVTDLSTKDPDQGGQAAARMMTREFELIPRPWRPVRQAPPLRPGSVHLWCFPPAPENPDVTVLQDEERRRADATGNPEGRRRFVHTRGTLRHILGSYLNVTPDQLVLATGAKGKPDIAAPATRLRFNLSHSGELTLLAVAEGVELGLDVERIRPRRGLTAIARRMFGPAEAAELGELADPRRTQEFHRRWTRLEASVKALGLGLFDTDELRQTALPHAYFTPQAGYQACLALQGAPPATTEWLSPENA